MDSLLFVTFSLSHSSDSSPSRYYDVLHNSCNMCTRDLPDICMYVCTRACVTTITCNIPSQNLVHVTCMLHEILMDLYDSPTCMLPTCCLHVAMLMYMHVSCNMHGTGSFP